jgi:hypothetical protein
MNTFTALTPLLFTFIYFTHLQFSPLYINFMDFPNKSPSICRIVRCGKLRWVEHVTRSMDWRNWVNPRSTDFLGTVIIYHLTKKLPAFFETRMFTACLLSLSCAKLIHASIIIVIISIQPLGRFWQEPEPSQATGMALARCILGKFLGIVCHYFLLESMLYDIIIVIVVIIIYLTTSGLSPIGSGCYGYTYT